MGNAKARGPRARRVAQATAPVAPAVHGSQLWGGPQLVENATAEPVFVETKAQYFDLLNSAGLRMKDQQESSTGPKKDPREDAIVAEIVRPKVAPMRAEEAEIYGAITAIYRRYGLRETLWCHDCFARNDLNHGCRMKVGPKGVGISCRCGTAIYKAPTGTPNVVLQTLANMTVVELDKTTATINLPIGRVTRPAIVLHDMEALLIRRYFEAMTRRHKEPRWFHTGCYRGHVYDEDNAAAIKVTKNDVMVICECRMLFHRTSRVVLPA